MTLALCSTVLLGACGGGAGDEPETPAVTGHAVPAAALASPSAFTRYVAALPASDSAEPLAVTGLMPPTSETDEPIEL